jgi:Tfp pilus assembly protein PilF
MSKPMLVTLPFVLLLLDVWPLGRYRWGGGGAGTSAVRLIGEKIPLFALAAGAGVVTIQTVAAAGALPDMTDMPLDVRIAHALVSYVLYIWKMIWPLDLAVFYPHPGHWPLWATASAVLFLGSVTALCILSLCNRPYIAIGWLWFVGTMVPVIGLVQVGSHGMADRYTYIPLIGLFVLGVWGAEDLFRRFGDDWRIPAVLSAVLLTILTGLSWRQAQYWRDSSALYGHALRVTENNYLAYNNLGAVLMDAGKYDEAMRHFQKVLEIRPRYPIAHNNAGNLYALRKDYKRAVEHFQKAVQYAPNYYEARRNWGDVLIQKGDPDGALALYEPLRAQNPADPELLNNVGVAWVCKGDPDRAVIYFRQAVRLNPAYREARENLRRVTDRKSP